jgi:hypothetical protein
MLEMAKLQRILGLGVSLLLIVLIAPANSEEVPKDKLCLKTGNDETRTAAKDSVRCRKARGMIFYSVDDAHLTKTFGDASGILPIARGEEKEPLSTPAPQREQQLKIGPTFSSFRYKEPGVMELDGAMYGIAATYNHRSENGLRSTVCLRYAFGPGMDYTGATWGGAPVTAKADDYAVEIRGLLGGRNLFTGLGYRYWNDKIKASGAYEREILYWYVPFGIEVSKELSEKWVGRMKAEYDFFIAGKVYSHLSEAVMGFNDPENEQDSGYGFRFSLELIRQLESRYVLSIEPFFIFWDIDESDYAILTYYGTPTAYVYEPENKTRNYGIQLNLYF